MLPAEYPADAWARIDNENLRKAHHHPARIDYMHASPKCKWLGRWLCDIVEGSLSLSVQRHLSAVEACPIDVVLPYLQTCGIVGDWCEEDLSWERNRETRKRETQMQM